MVFHDGSLAHAPIAPVEVQGYVYDAKLRIAELARRVWDDEEPATRLEREASALRERFDAAFWLEEHGWYALGLDRDKRPVDALASNMGHLLWSGIVPDERVARGRRAAHVRPALVGMGRAHACRRRAGVRPARVPQRNGLATRQFADRARSGAAPAGRAEASQIVRAHLDAAPFFDYRLPEHFAGYDRHDPEAPESFPARPGRRRGPPGRRCCCSAPSSASSPIRIRARYGSPGTRSRSGSKDWCSTGFRAFGRRWRVRVENGVATVE